LNGHQSEVGEDEEYMTKLVTTDAGELAAAVSLSEVKYPCILLGVGSGLSVYLVSKQYLSGTWENVLELRFSSHNFCGKIGEQPMKN